MGYKLHFICIDDGQVAKFAITDSKRYVSVINLSIQENVKQLDQLKIDFERTINWNNNQ